MAQREAWPSPTRPPPSPLCCLRRRLRGSRGVRPRSGLSAAQTDRLAEKLGLVPLPSSASKIAVSPERWRIFIAASCEDSLAITPKTRTSRASAGKNCGCSCSRGCRRRSSSSRLQGGRAAANWSLDGSFVRLPAHTARLTPPDEAACGIDRAAAGWRGAVSAAESARHRGDDRGGRDAMSGGCSSCWADGLGRRSGARSFLPAGDRARDGGHCRRSGGQGAERAFTAAQFRDRVDNGRKVAIQILEFFDRHGVTLRRGDLRRINQHRLDLFGPGDGFCRREWKRIVPGGAFGLQIRKGQRAGPWWVRLPLSSATISSMISKMGNRFSEKDHAAARGGQIRSI